MGDDILIAVDPADPDVNYTWNMGATGTSIVAQNAGLYTATGINANGCFHSASFEIPARAGPLYGPDGML